METYNPDYVLILSGDHIYKMDYKIMLDYHKANNADITIAAMPVPMEEASRFGVVVTDKDSRITEFEEKPEHPKSNLASMGIYIFSWKVLKEALIKLKNQQGCDFGKHVIPYCFENNKRIYASLDTYCGGSASVLVYIFQNSSYRLNTGIMSISSMLASQ